MSDVLPLGIIGAGAFGTALANLVAASGTPVWLDTEDEADARDINTRRRHDRRLPGVELAAGITATAQVGEVASRARLLVLAVSSRRALEVLPALARHVDGRHAIVHAIGALVEHHGQPLRLSELIRAETAVRRVGVIAGPALARDLVDRRPAALLVASSFDEVTVATRTALQHPPSLRVYGSRDLVGAELAAAIAGVLTLGLGLADGLGMGPGPRALLIARAGAEASRLAEAAGGDGKTVTGLAGLGNALARSAPGSAEGSDDYQSGLALVRGSRAERPSEGARTVPTLVKLAARLRQRSPILLALEAALAERAPVAQLLGHLLESPAEAE